MLGRLYLLDCYQHSFLCQADTEMRAAALEKLPGIPGDSDTMLKSSMRRAFPRSSSMLITMPILMLL